MVERDASDNMCMQVIDQKEHRSSKVLHAVEVAEKTVINAVREEVDILFNDKDHSHVQNIVSNERSKSIGRRSRKRPQVTDQNRFGWGLDQTTNF